MKLTQEQKSYLQSIDSKKKRKKQKTLFENENFFLNKEFRELLSGYDIKLEKINENKFQWFSYLGNTYTRIKKPKNILKQIILAIKQPKECYFIYHNGGLHKINKAFNIDDYIPREVLSSIEDSISLMEEKENVLNDSFKKECKTDFGEFFNNVFKNDEVEEEKKPKVGSSLAKEQLRDLTSPKEKQQGAFAVGNKPYNQDDIDKICNKESISAIEKSKEYARQEAKNIRFSLNDMKMCWEKSRREYFFYTGLNFETFIKSLEK